MVVSDLEAISKKLKVSEGYVKTQILQWLG